MNGHENLWVIVCYALGQTAIVFAVVYGCAFGLDKLGTAMLRRRRAARVAPHCVCGIPNCRDSDEDFDA